jgi:hypothetical protein
MALYDPATSTLTVRNTALNLELTDLFIEQVALQAPKLVAFTAHVIEAPDSLLFLAPAAEKRDDSRQLQDLLAIARFDSSVRVVHTAFLETPSGQRATLESAAKHEHTEKVAPDDKGRMEVHGVVRPLGFRFEIDPIILADGLTIDANLVLQLTSRHQQSQEGAAPTPFERRQVQTQITLFSGRTRLVGTWPVAEGRSQAVFLTASVIPQQSFRSFATSLTNLPKEAETMMEHTFVLPSQFLRRQTDPLNSDWSELPPLKGLELPPRSKVSVGPQGLTVRTTAEMMTVVDASVQHLLDTLPKSLTFRLEVFRAPAHTMRQLVPESASLSDHSSALQNLKAAVTTGAATQEILNILETNGGSAKLKAHHDRHVVTELNWLNDQQPGVATQRRPSGLDFEIDTQITGESAIPFSFALERHFTPPRPWSEPLLAVGSDRPLLMPRDEFPCARIQCSSRIIDGHTKLIGLWRPVGEFGKLGEDLLEAAFLTVQVGRQAPAKENTPTHLPTNSSLDSEPVPTGMNRKAYKVPHTFLHFDWSPSSTMEPGWDPFTTPLPRDDRNVLTKRGITDPKGSSMLFNSSTCELMVVNTPANLALIELWVQEAWQRTEKVALTDLYLIEGALSDLAPILAENASGGDPMKSLRSLLDASAGRVRTLAFLKGVSKSGGEAKFANTHDATVLSEIVRIPSEAHQRVLNTKQLGTEFTVSPSLSADSQTITLTCSLTHHPAPPASRTENLAPPGSPPIEIPLTDFHVESYEGSLTMTTGTSRILAVWKPTGRPEFAEKDLLHVAILEARAVPVED